MDSVTDICKYHFLCFVTIIQVSDVNRKPKFWLSDKKPKPIWFLVFQLKFYWYFVGFKILTNFRCRDNSS